MEWVLPGVLPVLGRKVPGRPMTAQQLKAVRPEQGGHAEWAGGATGEACGKHQVWGLMLSPLWLSAVRLWVCHSLWGQLLTPETRGA